MGSTALYLHGIKTAMTPTDCVNLNCQRRSALAACRAEQLTHEILKMPKALGLCLGTFADSGDRLLFLVRVIVRGGLRLQPLNLPLSGLLDLGCSVIVDYNTDKELPHPFPSSFKVRLVFVL